MFRFEYSENLVYLWVVPIVIFGYVLYLQYRRRQLAQLGERKLIERLTGKLSPIRNHIRIGLVTITLLAFALAYANPQWGNKKAKVEAKSSDIFIAMDISQSMMAEDISPNRLERAKRMTMNLIRALRGNRIGLIYFAGNAYLQMPLSNDYSAAELFISSANTGQATTQGTAISEAIDLALQSYEDDIPTQRGLIIITDGESHDGDAIAAAKDAVETGMKIFTIGVGTTEGAFVPYRTSSGEQYKRDVSGSPVKSALNTELIKDLANAGGGDSYLIGQGNEIIIDMKKNIDQLEKQEVEQRAFTDYGSYFQYLLAAGLILLIIEFLLPESSSPIASGS